MTTPLEAVDALRARVSSLANVAERIAARAAPLVEAAIRKQAAAGLNPDGVPWAPLADGGRALAGVEAQISTRAEGDLVVTTLEGGATWSDRSKGGRLPARKVLPDGGAGIPKYVGDAIAEAARAVLSEGGAHG